MKVKNNYIDLKFINTHVCLITINNPPVNVLKDELLSELEETVDELINNESVRVLIITGAGEKAFVAGADISQFPEMRSESSKGIVEKGKIIFDKIENAPFPIIGVLNGYTLGGGLELALACDFRIAAQNAIFGFPEVGLGIYPGYGGTQRLPRLVGIGKAKELIFSGETIDADEAIRIGLVEQLTPVGVALQTAIKVADKIASRAPLAVAKSKQVINEGMQLSLEEGQELETEYFGELADSDDKNEGVAAFIEKRKPNFQRR